MLSPTGPPGVGQETGPPSPTPAHELLADPQRGHSCFLPRKLGLALPLSGHPSYLQPVALLCLKLSSLFFRVHQSRLGRFLSSLFVMYKVALSTSPHTHHVIL